MYQLIDITEKLTPYLIVQAKELISPFKRFNTSILELDKDNDPYNYKIDAIGVINRKEREPIRSVLCNFIQVVVKKTIPNILVRDLRDDDDIVEDKDYRKFGFIINHLTETGIFKHGILGTPFQLEVSMENGFRRVVLGIYPFSDISPLEIRKLTTAAVKEGDLGGELITVYNEERKKGLDEVKYERIYREKSV